MRASSDIVLRVANISSAKLSINANRNLVFEGNYTNLTISTTQKLMQSITPTDYDLYLNANGSLSTGTNAKRLNISASRLGIRVGSMNINA